MKRSILSMAMIIVVVVSSTIGLCFGDSTDAISTDVAVLATVSASFEISEKVTIEVFTYDNTPDVDSIKVTNLTSYNTIKVEKIMADNIGDWTLKSRAEVETAPTNSPYLYLSMESKDLQDGVVPADGEVTGKNVSKSFVINGVVAKQSVELKDVEVAELVVTISVEPVKVNGFSIEHLQNEVTWATGEPKEIAAVIKAVDLGYVDPAELTGWDVGAERTVTLDAMTGDYDFYDEASNGTHYTGTLESHARQDVILVIMDVPGSAACTKMEWKNGTVWKSVSFIVGLKNCLAEDGLINSTNTNSGSWKASARRAWCNSTFYNAMLSAMGVTKEDNFFKRTYLVTGDYSSDDTTNGGSNIVTYDYFALPAEKEVFGSRTYGTANEYNNSYVVQFTWYKTKANRIKNLGTSSTAKWWWLRSPRAAAANSFVDVGSAGSVSWASAAYSNASGVSGGLAPFCCL